MEGGKKAMLAIEEHGQTFSARSSYYFFKVATKILSFFIAVSKG